jgi:hypothetical protein
MPYNSNVIVTGNWESDSEIFFTGATSTITFTGNVNTKLIGDKPFCQCYYSQRS